MENTKEPNYSTNNINTDMLKRHIGELVQLTVEYKEHNCTGNLEEGEDNKDTIHSIKTFNYHLLNIFTANHNSSTPNNYAFMLSTNNGKKILIPFCYEVVPLLSLKRRCQTMTHSITNITIEDKLNINFDQSNTFSIDDGRQKVIAHDEYTKEDAENFQSFSKLEKIGCKYDENTHTITGEILNLMRQYTPLFK